MTQRVIKFRAWDPEEKSMWYDNTEPCCDGKKKQNIMITMNGEIRICQWNDAGVTLHSYHHMILMQFTGLLDKDGKEIYEGDIFIEASDYKVEISTGYKITDPYTATCCIEYYKTEFAKRILHQENYRFGKYNPLEPIFVEEDGQLDCKIIGNIYENPELL